MNAKARERSESGTRLAKSWKMAGRQKPSATPMTTRHAKTTPSPRYDAPGVYCEEGHKRPATHRHKQQPEWRDAGRNPAARQLREDVAVGERGEHEAALHEAPPELLSHRDDGDWHDVAVGLVDGVRSRCEQDVDNEGRGDT